MGTLPVDGWCSQTNTAYQFQFSAGTVFEMIECDVCVPEALRERFAEIQPVFKNIRLTRDDLGPFMRRYAEVHNIMATPRRMLLGSYRSDKILSLLRWYLDHGFEVTHDYQVIDYDLISCFRRFSDALSTAWRERDVYPHKAIIVDTMTLLGNSGYGKTITNVDRQRGVNYCTGKAASLMINDRRFRQPDVVVDDVYELEMNKKTVTYALPIHVGFFVLQYTKMRMLQFYYDFINRYLERPLFQYCEMDTDSACLALVVESVDDLVAPDLREHYFRHLSEWLPSVATNIRTSTCDFDSPIARGSVTQQDVLLFRSHQQIQHQMAEQTLQCLRQGRVPGGAFQQSERKWKEP